MRSRRRRRQFCPGWFHGGSAASDQRPSPAVCPILGITLGSKSLSSSWEAGLANDCFPSFGFCSDNGSHAVSSHSLYLTVPLALRQCTEIVPNENPYGDQVLIRSLTIP